MNPRDIFNVEECEYQYAAFLRYVWKKIKKFFDDNKYNEDD